MHFDKNASFIYVIMASPFSRKVSLATIGVCVFCAAYFGGCTFYCETKTQRSVAWLKSGSADEQEAKKEQWRNVFVSKAPFTQGRLMLKPVYG